MQIAQLSSRELVNQRYGRMREHAQGSRNVAVGGSSCR